MATLFKHENGQAIRFSMPPGNEREQLSPLIQKHGGILTSRGSVDMRLAVTGKKVHSEGLVSTQYIHDCIKDGVLLDVEKYRLKTQAMSDVSDIEDEDGLNILRVGGEKTFSGRKSYMLNEDLAIIGYLIKNNEVESYTGNTVWKDMEFKKVTSHSWQSMKNRFKKYILTTIKQYSISKKDQKRFLKLLSDGNSVESEVEDEDEEPNIRKTAEADKETLQTSSSSIEYQSAASQNNSPKRTSAPSSPSKASPQKQTPASQNNPPKKSPGTVSSPPSGTSKASPQKEKRALWNNLTNKMSLSVVLSPLDTSNISLQKKTSTPKATSPDKQSRSLRSVTSPRITAVPKNIPPPAVPSTSTASSPRKQQREEETSTPRRSSLRTRGTSPARQSSPDTSMSSVLSEPTVLEKSPSPSKSKSSPDKAARKKVKKNDVMAFLQTQSQTFDESVQNGQDSEEEMEVEQDEEVQKLLDVSAKICEWLKITQDDFFHALYACSGSVSEAVNWLFVSKRETWSLQNDICLLEGKGDSQDGLREKFGATAVEERLKFLTEYLSEYR